MKNGYCERFVLMSKWHSQDELKRKDEDIKMESSINRFIESVAVNRSNGDDCEYEVTLDAMEKYLQYEFYTKEKWEGILHGNTIFNYMRNPNQKHRSGYRGISGYKGAYLLKEKKGTKVLTADMLTSHNVPKKICESKLNEAQLKEIDSYILAFEKVYRWCGNMVPVICNYQPGRGDFCGIDNCMSKLQFIDDVFCGNIQTNEEQYKEFLEGNGYNQGYKQLWPSWIKSNWDSIDKPELFTEQYLNG